VHRGTAADRKRRLKVLDARDSLASLPGYFLDWDFAVPSSLFSDTLFTSPVSLDGHNVGGILDLSGFGHHGTQGTVSRRGVYKVGIQNGHSALLLDGGDCYEITNPAQLDEVTVYFVGILNVTSASNPHVLGGQTNAFELYFPHSGGSTRKLIVGKQGVATLLTSTNAQANSVAALWVAQFSDAGDSVLARLDRAANGSASSAVQMGATTNVAFANNTTGGSGFRDYALRLLIYRAVHSTAQMQTVENILKARYATP
jgi:hypothetical protein